MARTDRSETIMKRLILFVIAVEFTVFSEWFPFAFKRFPLAVERENEIVIVPVPDPRAGMCPLLRCPEKIDRRFYRAVRRAGEYLMRDEDTRKYLLELSSEITDIAELAERL